MLLALCGWGVLAEVDAAGSGARGVQEQYTDFVKAWVDAKLKQMDKEIPPEKNSQLWDHILTPDFILKAASGSGSGSGGGDGTGSGEQGREKKKKGSIWARAMKNLKKKFGDVSRDAFKQGPVYQRRRDLKMIQSLYGDRVTDTTAELEKLMAPGERMLVSLPPVCCNKYERRASEKSGKKSSIFDLKNLRKMIAAKKQTAFIEATTDEQKELFGSLSDAQILSIFHELMPNVVAP